MNNHLRVLYRTTLAKYSKFRRRYEKNLQNGSFDSFSARKQSQIISRLKRLFQRLQQLKLQLKVAAATGVLSLSLSVGQAQQLGPFVENTAKNPIRSPLPQNIDEQVATVDIDNDGDFDVVIGRYNGDVAFFENVGTATNPAFINRVGSDNPFNGINQGYYASPAFHDLDGDGDQDLILGTYNTDLEFFENTGDVDNPAFSSIPNTTPHPVDNVINPTSYIRPRFADIDGDGDMDLFAGENVYSYSTNPIISFWQNDGTNSFTEIAAASNPVFSSVNFSDPTPQRAYPSFVDIDNDGDLDLFLGNELGTVRFFRNEGTYLAPSFPSENPYSANPFDGIDVGFNSSPEFVDIDDDGDFDAIVGSGDNDILKFFENTGTASSPTFVERTGILNPFDGFSATGDMAPTAADIDGDNFDDLVFGENGSQTLHYFTNNQDGSFTQQTGASNPFENILTSSDSRPVPAFVDLDNDSDLDLFVSIEYFYGPSYARLAFFDNTGSNSFSRRTNPTSPMVFDENYSILSATINDFDSDGDFDAIISMPGFNYTYSESLFLWDNIGNASSPNFSLDDPSTAPINGFTFSAGGYLKPYMVDLDNDGDMDLVTGIQGSTYSGQLFWFENDGTNLVQQTGVNSPFFNTGTGVNFDYGDNSHPTFIDIDNDNDLDIVLGLASGGITLIENQNVAPTVNLVNPITVFTEGDGPLTIDDGLTITDDTNDIIIGATVIITNFVASEDILSFTAAGSISGSYSASTGILTLSGQGTLAEYQTVLRSVTYENTSIAPDATDRIIEFAVTDFDNTSPTATQLSLPIAVINSVPVLAASVNADATFTENDVSPALVDNGITISDIDNTTLSGATVSISNNLATDEDELSFTATGSIMGIFDAASGVLTLSGSGTLAEYQTVLQSVSYNNTSEDPSALARTIDFVVNDGTDNSNTVSRTVNVVAVNDAPVISSTNTAALSYTQSATALLLDDLINITDVDNTDLTGATVTINSFATGDILNFTDQNGITGSFSEGVLTLSGTSSLANYITALRSITFESSNGTGSRTIDFIVNDGTDNSLVLSKTVDIIGSQPPQVNTTPATTRVGSTITVDLCAIISDPDNTFAELTITIVSVLSGATTNIVGCDLQIDYTGLSFSGEDQILVRATDPDGNTDENTLFITVEPGGELIIYNAVSPNNDGANDWWEIINLTTPNDIKLYNRWGDEVKSISNYGNVPDNSELNDLPAGTYFYRIESPQGSYEGFLVIKK